MRYQRPRRGFSRAFLVLVTFGLVGVMPSGVAVGAPGPKPPGLEMYTTVTDRPHVARMIREGVDVAAVRQARGGLEVDLVLQPRERARLESQGLNSG